MTSVAQRIFKRIYNKARRPEDLPWHRDVPPDMLQRVCSRRRGGNGAKRTALDLGCGAGVYAVWLAEQGYRVTAVDFTPKAVDMARKRAEQHSVDIDVVQADVLRWSESSSFDLILDSGCLHGFTGQTRADYRDRIVRWLTDGGDYVLCHFDRMHRLDWRPMGPRRIPRSEILALFSPALAEVETDHQDFPAPLPIGPRCRLRSYWFRHNKARP